MGLILRKWKHFWMYSDVTILFFVSVEQTVSAGGMHWIGLAVGGSKMDEREIRLSSSSMRDLVDASDMIEESSSSSSR